MHLFHYTLNGKFVSIINIYIYIYMCVCVCEPLRRNYRRLVPDSLSNYRYNSALLSIEHFLLRSLAALTVFFFSFDQPIACLDFFQLVWQGWGFSFFPDIYIFPIYRYYFPLTVIHCIFSSSNHLPGYVYHKGYYFIYIYTYIYIYIYIVFLVQLKRKWA